VPEPEAAVALVHAAPPCDSVLLMRRAERADDSWSGHWSFPGGRREDGDVDLLQTALRELEEECGVRLRREDLESALPERVAGSRVGRFMLVAPFAFHVKRELATILDPSEAAYAGWVPLSILRDPARHRLRNVPRGAPDLFFPAIELDVAPLWGFTWRVLVEWLNLGPRRDIAEVADALLDFVTAHGCSLEQGWNDGTARVRGRIPAEETIAHFAQPGPHIFAILRIEIRPDRIRLTDPAMREFTIESVTPST
jgi:8-oxo-dGTP pyrophosphatase MutT (NUDIX family)